MQIALYVACRLFKVVQTLNPKFYICLVACLTALVGFGGLARGADSDQASATGTLHTWRSADGLPSDLVTAIIQTRDGFLWVGTSAGLVRFDGVKFTPLKLEVSSPAGPVHVTALGEDSDGHLWIGTQQHGLFELAQGKMRHYSKTDGLLDDHVTVLDAGPRGQVWIGSKSGLNVWTGHEFQSFTTREGLSDGGVSGVNVARSGTVWITTRSGMCRSIGGHIAAYTFPTESQGRSPEYLGTYEDRRGNLWAFGDTYLINLNEGQRFNYFRSSESASVRIWSLCEGRDGRLWIGTSGRGLFCFKDNRFQPVILGENRSPEDVRAICEDREGNLWLGTSGGGLVQLRPQSVHVLRAGQGLPNRVPTALALDVSGRMYVGVQRGGLFVGELGRFDRVGGRAGLLGVQNFVSSVCVTRNGTVWAGTLGDGLYGLRNGHEIHLTTANGLADARVLTVCVDGPGAVWAGTGDGTLHRFDGHRMIGFDTRQGLPGTPVTVMIPAAASGLWLGTEDGQILHEENEKFTRVALTGNFEHCCVLALHEGDQNRLWIGTAGGGLACWAKGMAVSWNTNNGLPSAVVAGVVEDELKNLWLATGAGIYRISRNDVQQALNNPRLPLGCKLISAVKSAPVSPMFFGGMRAVFSPNRELWFVTSEGLLNIDVDTRQSEIMSSTLFPVCIESAAFNGQPPVSLLQGELWTPQSAPGPRFKTPVDLRSLEIHFTALSYALPEDLQFRHKLEGFDPDWVNDAGVRSVRYGRLPYGHYRFRVTARNVDGNWQEAAETFAFEVPTPLYFQTWAIGLYVISAIALVAGIVRIVSHRRLRFALERLEQQQSLERERMRIARDMHDEMGSKLTKMSFLSERAQVEAESSGLLAEKIRSIAQTSRQLLQTMDEIVWVVNPRNDTLENLIAYLSHHAVEYFQNTPIECGLHLPHEIPHYPLSSEERHNLFLTFEEALNNVLKHSAATHVQVEMAFNAAEFELKVTDNGRGFEMPAAPAAPVPAHGGRGGNGLKNMRQRLTAIGGEYLVSSQPGQGTTITMRIPLRPKRAGQS
jgi:signal transduction histidine kinase/ligand-binding sensor domain-containing protein